MDSLLVFNGRLTADRRARNVANSSAFTALISLTFIVNMQYTVQAIYSVIYRLNRYVFLKVFAFNNSFSTRKVLMILSWY